MKYRPNIKRPKKIGRTEKRTIDQMAESNVWTKIKRHNITFGRKQKGQIGAEIVGLRSRPAHSRPLFRSI